MSAYIQSDNHLNKALNIRSQPIVRPYNYTNRISEVIFKHVKEKLSHLKLELESKLEDDNMLD